MRYNFLVIRWSGMGDIVMTLPALGWLKDHYGNCHISYLTDTAFAGIVERSGLADRVVGIDRRGFAAGRRFFPALTGLITGLLRLRRKKIDTAFDLQGFGETALIAYLSGAPVRVGRIKSSFLRQRIYNAAIRADWEKEHRARYFLRAVADECGGETPAVIRPPHLPAKTRPADSPTKRIGVNLGASTESRRWSEQKFFELATNLAKQGHTIRMFLGPQETFLAGAARGICLKNDWEFSTHRRLAPLMDALAQCDLLISNDTGPGHLAAALGLPVVTLFSSGDPENVKPLARQARWFRNETDINQIRVADVLAACLELLNTDKD